MSGWIGVDFDATLAHYTGWKDGEALGAPIPMMVERVKQWVAEGREVRIFTARVAETGLVNQVGGVDDRTFAQAQREAIEEWCEEHVGVRLAVTAVKDFGMIEVWDDRCVRIMPNTGERCCEREVRIYDR